MQGNLERINLADVLLTLHLTKRNGILRLSRNDVKKSIYFVEGAIVFAHSNQKHDRLGETLLRLGKITQEEFENASREVIEKGKRLGQVLTELGYIPAQEVSASVHYQLQQIVYSLFDWDSGDYEFIERERPVYEDIMIDISTPALIIEGIRNISNPDVLKRSYQENENQILYPQTGAPRMPRNDLYFGEETILACVDGTKTIAAVRQLALLSPMDFDRSLFSLLLSGMLNLEQQPKLGPQDVRAADPRLGVKTQPMPESVKKKEPINIKTLSEPELRQLVAATQKKFEDAVDEEVLNVLPDCTIAEVKKAYADLCSQFQAPFYSLDRFLDIKDPLKAVLDRAAVAHDNLIAKITARMPLSDAPLAQGAALNTNSMNSDPLPTNPESTPQKQRGDTPVPNVSESLADLQERIRKEPNNTALLRRLGRRLYETGKPHDSEKQYLRALELEPQNVENHLALAEFYTGMGLKMKAFKHLNIILQLHPNHDRAMEMLNLKKSKKPLYEI